MTRLITDGAEMGDMLFWTYISNITSCTVQLVSTYGGSGVYIYQVADTPYVYKNIIELSECYFRIRVRGDPFTRNDGVEAKHIAFYKDGTLIAHFGPDHSQHYSFYVNGSEVAIGTPTHSDATWYLVEGYFKMSDTSGSGILKVNGITEIEYGGDTKPGTATTFNRILLSGAGSGMGSPLTKWDDIALNDTSGSVDNSWCGEGRIEKLAVNDNGDLNEWTPSSGSAWQCVDDIPPNGETDYITSRVSGQRDMFNLTAFTDTNKTIRRIWIDSRAEDYAAMASKIKVGLKTSGSVFMGAEDTLPSAYKRVASGEFLVDPTSGKVWTKTELDALQAVVESI